MQSCVSTNSAISGQLGAKSEFLEDFNLPISFSTNNKFETNVPGPQADRPYLPLVRRQDL